MLMNASLSVGLTGLPDAHQSAGDDPAMPAGSGRSRDAARAIMDLRRGATVIVVGGHAALAFATIETIDAAGFDTLRRLVPAGMMKLRPAREDNVASGHLVVAEPVDGSESGPDDLRRLADPLQLPLTGAPLRGARHEIVPPALAPAAIALAKLALLLPIAIGGAARDEDVETARAAGTLVVEAADISALAASRATLLRVGEASVPLSEAAGARVVAFRNPATGVEHIAVVIGSPEARSAARPAPLVRLHSECFTGDVLGSLRCDCGPQLHSAMRRMTEEGCGVVLYLAQEGRGIGLLNKLRSYVMQDRGLDTVEANQALGWGADERDFSLAATMLRDLGIDRIRLLTNNPEKVAALASNGIDVERASLLIAANGVNDTYLATKLTRFGHLPG